MVGRLVRSYRTATVAQIAEHFNVGCVLGFHVKERYKLCFQSVLVLSLTHSSFVFLSVQTEKKSGSEGPAGCLPGGCRTGWQRGTNIVYISDSSVILTVVFVS